MTKEQLNRIVDELYLQSQTAIEKEEIPVSACLVLKDGRELYDFNSVEKNNDPFSHAEMNVIQKALKETNSRYLEGATLIVTLEPCLLCMGAILKVGIKDIYYILDDMKLGSLSHYHAFVDDRLRVNRIEDSRFKPLFLSFFEKMRKE